MTTSGTAMGSPDETRGGRDLEEATANAEAGTAAEGDHVPVGEAESGESRLEQMTEVEQTGTTGDGSGSDPEPGPGPTDVGSGGAQRVVGARISDRVAGGEPVPDGPPFDDEH